MTELKVAVITTEPRAMSNRLWAAARDRVDQLLVVGPRTDYYGADAADPDVVQQPVRGPQHKPTFRHLTGLVPLLRGFDPDVIHLNNELWGVENVVVAKGVPDAALIVHGAENQFPTSGLTASMRRRVGGYVLRRLAGYASWNQAGAEYASALAPNLPTLVAPAIIPPPVFQPATWQPEPLPKVFQVMLIGRLVEMKGFADAITALGTLTDRDRFAVHVYGTGEQQDRLRRLANQAGVATTFHGQQDSATVYQAMTRMQCLIQPSKTTPAWSEQFGRTVAEAMTVGLPCLVSSSGELPNVVGDPEFVFAEGDVDQLAAKLDRLQRTPELLADWSIRQSDAAAARFAPEPASAALLDFWARVHAARSSTAVPRRRVR